MGHKSDQEQAGCVTRATISLPIPAFWRSPLATLALGNHRIKAPMEAAQITAQTIVGALIHPITSHSSALLNCS
jgi:hypothetical protein